MKRTLALFLALPAPLAFATPTWWFNDPNYPGDRNVGYYVAIGGQPAYTWYDDDVPWPTGSVVRLPEDANYLGDVLTTVYCYTGGTQTMHSPYFIGADGKVFFFNHLETRYLPNTGWYNGGAVIGLTGGGTCVTGYGTFGNGSPVSTGPHFCIETANQHADIDFPPGYNPTSSCTHSDGSSGQANILCTSNHPQCAPFACGSTYYWNCQSDGNLHSCDASGNLVTTNCNGLGCHVTGTCTNDVCNNACAPYTYQGHYYWTCQSDGNLHSCDANGNLITQNCGGAGCNSLAAGVNDTCKSPCAPYTYNGQYYWTCEMDGNLHSCDASGTPVTTNCNGAGCKTNAVGTNDVGNPTISCKPYACGSTFYWTCGTDGDLHSCDTSGNPATMSCAGKGCHTNGTCTDDSCGPATPTDAGSSTDAGISSDAGAVRDAGRPESDAGEATDGGADDHTRIHGGCSASGEGALGLAAVILALALRRRFDRV